MSTEYREHINIQITGSIEEDHESDISYSGTFKLELELLCRKYGLEIKEV